MASTTLPPVKPPGPAHQQQHARSAVEEGRLGVREREAVVGRADDQRAVREAELMQGVEDRADALVEGAGARLEGRHVLAGRRRVGQVGAAAASRACRGPRSGPELAVGLEEADRHEEGLRRRVAQRLDRDRGDVDGVIGCRPRSPRRSRSPPGPRRCAARRSGPTVAGGVQRVDQMLAVVVERPAAVREAEHAVVVAVLAGEQRRRGCPSRSARRRRPRGTARPGRRAAGCSASAPGSRRAARSGRCRANGCRGRSDVRCCRSSVASFLDYLYIETTKVSARRSSPPPTDDETRGNPPRLGDHRRPARIRSSSSRPGVLGLAAVASTHRPRASRRAAPRFATARRDSPRMLTFA